MRTITVTFADGSSHAYQNAPDDVTPEMVEARAVKEFGKQVSNLDGGKGQETVSTQQEYTQPKPFGQQMNEAISDIPRQVGLTARYGIEGVGNVADMVATPFRAAINAVSPDSMQLKGGGFNKLADAIGLPSPKNERERIIGEGAKMMAGGAVPIGVASKVAEGTTGTANAITKLLAANPGSQVASAGSSGAAGQYVKETGGNEGSQLLAALAAGVATPLAMGGVRTAANTIGKVASSMKPVSAQETAQAMQQLDIKIESALKPTGLKLADLPKNVLNSLRQDVGAAMKADGVLSPDAVRRLADYRIVGATPTVGTLTLDPAIVSQQKNLQKIGINSKDPAAQQLGRLENENNRQLITGLNDLGANTPDTPIIGGRKVMEVLDGRNAAAKSVIDDLYGQARETSGRSAMLDPSAFTQTASDMLDYNLLGGKIPADVRNRLNAIAKGDHPLTVDTAEQFKTQIAALQRASADGAERRALGLVRQALDETPLIDGSGAEAQAAFDTARKANRGWMGVVDKTPALQAVRDGMEPDKFVQTFIVGNGGKANRADLEALKNAVSGNKQALDAIRSQITAHLKSKALNGSADEVGNLSQSAYNRALTAIGDEKLSLFFTPEQVNQIKAIGRVASYEQFQPKGSAVNNSNTAGALVSTMLDKIGMSPLLSKIPLGNMLQEPVQNISVGLKSQRALNPVHALTRPKANQGGGRMLLSPAAFIGRENQE